MAQQVCFVRVQVTSATGILVLYKCLWGKFILGLGSAHILLLIHSEKKLVQASFGCHLHAFLKKLNSSSSLQMTNQREKL